MHGPFLVLLSALSLPALADDRCPVDAGTLKALDAKYQAAVASNDADTMDRLLAESFTLVTGKGAVYTKADLLAEARGGATRYTRQDDAQQTVRFVGGVAVVTALLTAQGESGDKPFGYRLWFSDVYACTPQGWRYSFAQAAGKLD